MTNGDTVLWRKPRNKKPYTVTITSLDLTQGKAWVRLGDKAIQVPVSQLERRKA